MTEGKQPAVAVIIPAYNEEKIIEKCLASLERQSFQNFTAYMIDDQSTDRTAELIKKYANKPNSKIVLKQFGKVGPGRARNLVAREVNADILAFMDADCEAMHDWLEQIVKAFGAPEIGSVGGPHLAPPDSMPFQLRVEEFLKRIDNAIEFYKPETPRIITTNHNPLCNVAYRRDVFLKTGGFREDLFPGEDVAIDYEVRKLGFQILYTPKAIVFHRRPDSIARLRRVMHLYGRAQGKLVRDYGFKRRLQISGGFFFAFSSMWLGYSAVTASWASVAICLVVLGLCFFWRPNSEASWSIYINGLQWLNGFIEGFVTNRSQPPGFTPPKGV